MPANAFASDAGPFNPTTGLACSNPTNYGYCLSTDAAITMQINPFPGERMFSVYDGPAFQQANAFLDVYPTLLTGDLNKWMYWNRHVDGVPKDSSSQCYLPNAAIAWKQPNGFYYPPAFHSQNLMFANTKPAPGLIRHFLIEPLFKTLSKPMVPPVPNTDAITARYCSGTDSPGMFNNFTDIDRQTVLNDGVPDTTSTTGMNVPGGDGALTGLVGTQESPTKTTGRETISVNEDAFFNAPVERVECASDKHPTSNDGKGAPGTAKTSPYEYVTTGMIAKCALGYYTIQCPCNGGTCPITYPYECAQSLNTCTQTYTSYWTHQSANPQSFGVPLYREYLTGTEYAKSPRPKPFIQMMGQGSGQRSTLTLNHGRFYIDTSNNCAAQGGCKPYQPNSGVSVFQGGQTYYVYFIYGRASTYLTFDIYLGPNCPSGQNGSCDGKWTVNPVRGVLDGEPYVFNDVTGSPEWLPTPTYDQSTNVLTVTVDLSKSTIATDFSSEFGQACQPTTYCAVKEQDGKTTCGCKAGTSCKEDVACSWGPKDGDWPNAGAYGFSFTMPSDWNPPANHVDPPAGLIVPFTSDAYFTNDYNNTNKPNVNLVGIDPSKFGQNSQCDYRQ